MGSLLKLKPIKLKPNEIHLWLAFPDEIQDDNLLTAYEKLMTRDEYERYERYRFLKDRRLYLITRALVRTTLSRYIDIDPRHWRFSKNQYGRPEIVASGGMPRIRFNISHTNGLVICGVVLEQDIGVDVENVERSGVAMEIPQKFFSCWEVEDLYSLPTSKMQDRFFHYWTLKESYIKARGMGLYIPLQQFAFHLSEDKPLSISFDPELNDDPNKWRFWLLKPTKRHYMAVSLCHKSAMPYRLITKKVVPFVNDDFFDCDIINTNCENHKFSQMN